jgi:transcriptional regulator with GAF, ATPase, and Fis domain
VKISCGSLSETLLESELFGHVRGAFTGAIRDKKGKFEEAQGGTIFLDDINSASPNLQVKLLRVLQEKVIERVGGNTPIHTDVRIITATNTSFREEVAKGTSGRTFTTASMWYP